MKLGQDWYFISKNQPGLRHSHPLKSSPSSHFLLVSDSVGTTSSSLFWHFRSWSASRPHIYITSASWYPSETCNCARLLIVVTQAAVYWRSHDNNVRHIIIACMVSADTQIFIHTNRRRKRKVILWPASHAQSAQLAGKSIKKVTRCRDSRSAKSRETR